MVEWWQTRISEKYQYPSDKRISAMDFNTELKGKYGERGQYLTTALDYFLESRFPNLVRPTDRILYDDQSAESRIYFVRSWLESRPDSVTESLTKYFTSGNYIASVYGKTASGSSLEWTLWGMEVESNNSNKISHVWATDSSAGAQGKADQKLHKLAIIRDGDKISFKEDGENGITITPVELTFFGIDDKLLVDKDGKSIFSPLIPEPSAFGLLAGTLALVLAGTRRTRKKLIA